MRQISNEEARIQWVHKTLASIPEGKSILDVGAGECQYKKFCGHLRYLAQDVGIYDGLGDEKGLQTGLWDFSQIDITCDILDILEEEKFDVILCTEVLEHVPDAVRVIEKLVRLLAPGGEIIVTAPFASMTHFAPYHYATGFSSYFYKYHFDRLQCDIIECAPNGGFFEFGVQQLDMLDSVCPKYLGHQFGALSRRLIKVVKKVLAHAANEDGPRESRKSAELLTFGWHVRARLRTQF